MGRPEGVRAATSNGTRKLIKLTFIKTDGKIKEVQIPYRLNYYRSDCTKVIDNMLKVYPDVEFLQATAITEIILDVGR